MNVRIRLACAFLIREFADNHQKQGDFWRIVANVETVLHQGAYWAVLVTVKIVVMVLRDRKQSRNQQGDYDGLQELHFKIQSKNYSLSNSALRMMGKPLPASSFSKSKSPEMVMSAPSCGYSEGNLRGLASSKARPCEQQARASWMTQP